MRFVVIEIRLDYIWLLSSTLQFLCMKIRSSKSRFTSLIVKLCQKQREDKPPRTRRNHILDTTPPWIFDAIGYVYHITSLCRSQVVVWDFWTIKSRTWSRSLKYPQDQCFGQLDGPKNLACCYEYKPRFMIATVENYRTQNKTSRCLTIQNYQNVFFFFSESWVKCFIEFSRWHSEAPFCSQGDEKAHAGSHPEKKCMVLVWKKTCGKSTNNNEMMIKSNPWPALIPLVPSAFLPMNHMHKQQHVNSDNDHDDDKQTWRNNKLTAMDTIVIVLTANCVFRSARCQIDPNKATR